MIYLSLPNKNPVTSRGLVTNTKAVTDTKVVTTTKVMTNTTVQPIQSVNWTGLSSTPTLESTAVLNLATLRQDDTILFTPPEAENTNKPVGRDIQTVTTTGIEGTQPITKDSKTGAGLALLAGMVLLGV